MKISKETAEHYLWRNSCDGWHLVKNNNLSIIHERMLPNTEEVRHYHQKSLQFFFVLKRNATIEVNGDLTDLVENEGIEVPPLVPHQMFNQSSKEDEFLVIS
jgi:mannose-6-phosphate isomerase-like protein (cupin superfamily)